MPSSVFTRPRARPALAAISSQQNRIDVATEDELLAALTSLPRYDGSCYGKAVNIVRDIKLTRTVELTLIHSGITITSSSKSKINSDSSVESAFSIGFKEYCYNVTIDGLTIGDGFLSKYFLRYFDIRSIATIKNISIPVFSTAPTIEALVAFSEGVKLRVESCVDDWGIKIITPYYPLNPSVSVLFDSQIISNSGFENGISGCALNNVVVSGNMYLGGWDSLSSSTSFTRSENVCFSGNTLWGSIIVRNPFSKNISIVGNSFIASPLSIDTSATAGSNSIVGNTNVGTITNAATDAVTSNT